MSSPPTFLTRRQMDTILALRRMQRSRGIPPTLQELSDELVVSKTTAYEHLARLTTFGLVTPPAFMAERSRCLTTKGERFARRKLGGLGMLREAWKIASSSDRKAFLNEARRRRG